MKSPRGYLKAGYPRYNHLFGRDSLISAWQMLTIDPQIAKHTLQILAQYQGKKINPTAEEQPGKILHEHRFSTRKQAELPHWDFPYYGSVDSTPLFLIVAAKYLQETKDRTFLLKLWNNIIAAHHWITHYGDPDQDGYIEYQKMNPHGLFHQGWKDGTPDRLRIQPPVAIVEAQGYLYQAYQGLIYLQKELQKEEISTHISERAETLKNNFNKDFWMEEERYFALALDGEQRQRRVVTSNPGHLLFTGLLEKEKLEHLVARLFQSDLWTPYGIRTHSSQAPDFDPYSYHMGTVWPHDNWIIYKGLQLQGFQSHAHRIKNALLRAFDKLEKIPELYPVIDDRIIDPIKTLRESPPMNPLQACASAGLLEMIWDD
ncbi:MAG: hypothetical protein GWN86_25050 [Desulfobacterales bacterium]|nr:hypothetical protein [Desulfobacterales bacterium]